METHCINARNKFPNTIYKNGNPYNEKFKTSTSSIKECFKEYTLEDKIEALKNMLDHNNKNAENVPPRRNDICNIKQTIGVKECLQPDNKTSFQTIISELRNTVVNSYWNKEVGRTRYQIANLPVGTNPLEVTFGKTLKSDTMAEVLKEEIKKTDIPKEKIIEMYKRSHNNYPPAEQSTRNYKKPFDRNSCFGEIRDTINTEGARLKKRLAWFNAEPNTIVNSNLADFLERSRSRVGEVK